jgi:hypothetical protein
MPSTVARAAAPADAEDQVVVEVGPVAVPAEELAGEPAAVEDVRSVL